MDMNVGDIMPSLRRIQYEKPLVCPPMDLSKESLSDALKWLDTEQYKESLDLKMTATTEAGGDYCFLYVSDDYNCNNLNYCHEYYYTLDYYNEVESMMDDVGIIFCGGMYTAVGIFHKGLPISTEYLCHMNHVVPPGKQLCKAYLNGR